MQTPRLDRELYVIGDPSAHLEFLNCERIAERSHIHGWSVEEHYHEGLTQLFVFGEARVDGRIDHASHSISGPAVIWVPSLCSHGFEYQPGMEGWVITVATTDVARLSAEAAWFDRWASTTQLLHGHEHRPLLSRIMELTRQVEAEHEQRNEGHNLALESLFLLLLINLNRGLAAATGRSGEFADRRQQLFTRFQTLLDSQHETARSVSDYADLLSVTPTHLTRTIKSVTGRTAGELINDRLVLSAKRKLAFTDQTVAEIAYLLAFSSPSYFTRFFAAQTGETPRRFRKRIRGHSD